MNRSLEDIARRYFESQEQYGTPAGCGCLTGGFACLMLFAGLMLALDGDPSSAESVRAGVEMSLFGAGVLGVSGLLIWWGVAVKRRRVSWHMQLLRAGEPFTVQTVHRFATGEFRQRIEVHRARTLGRDSEWAVARRSLRGAANDAQRSAAYWRTRVGQEPDNQMAIGQASTATELEDKLRSALAKLDARAEILLEFYNDCEARIAVMDRHTQDIEETRRLDALSESTDVVIAGAEATLAAIAAEFVREAHRVGTALGGFERLQIKSLAGEAPLDDIEYLADRIIESSESETAAVEQLKSALNRISH